MRKSEFINELRRHLHGLPAADIDDVVRDQEEYIVEAMSDGRSEEEAVAGLGSPKEFAASIRAYSRIEKAAVATNVKERTTNVLGAVFAVVALAPFNLIFVLGPFLGCCGVLLGLWGATVGVLTAAVAAFVAFFTTVLFSSFEALLMAWYFFLSAGLIGVGILMVFVMAKITHWFGLGTLRYLKWNLKVIEGMSGAAPAVTTAKSV